MYTVTDSQLKGLLQLITIPENFYEIFTFTAFDTMLKTGCRSIEAITIGLWQPIDENFFTLYPVKNSAARIIPSSKLSAFFQEKIISQENIFEHVNYSRMRYHMEKLIGSYGIFTGAKDSVLHLYRHNYAKQLKASGLTDLQIQNNMGEVNLASANQYIYSLIQSRQELPLFGDELIEQNLLYWSEVMQGNENGNGWATEYAYVYDNEKNDLDGYSSLDRIECLYPYSSWHRQVVQLTEAGKSYKFSMEIANNPANPVNDFFFQVYNLTRYETIVPDTDYTAQVGNDVRRITFDIPVIENADEIIIYTNHYPTSAGSYFCGKCWLYTGENKKYVQTESNRFP